MPQRTDTLELGRLGLSSGQGRRLDLHVTGVTAGAMRTRPTGLSGSGRSKNRGCTERSGGTSASEIRGR